MCLFEQWTTHINASTSLYQCALYCKSRYWSSVLPSGLPHHYPLHVLVCLLRRDRINQHSNLAGADENASALAALVFLGARIAHTVLYLADLATLRTVAFLIGWGSCLWLFALAIRA